MAVEPEALARYACALRLPDPAAALSALAGAVAGSATWPGRPPVLVVARPAPSPLLAFLGSFDRSEDAWFSSQMRAANQALALMRYIDYAGVEEDCATLAGHLLDRFGSEALSTFHFTAIPRGGAIVLGMLSYALGLRQSQLAGRPPSEAPLVVVDDCAFTGARCHEFLAGCDSRSVIFCPLYSHPDLRAAIEAQEPRVQACLSAGDLHDHAPQSLGAAADARRREWLERVQGRRYWFGQTEHLCFPWSEPDRLVWHSGTGQVSLGWPLVPPELCLKNRPRPGATSIPVQQQPVGIGPLRPADPVVFGHLGAVVLAANIETGESLALEDVSASIWRAILQHGTRAPVVDSLAAEYDVPRPDLAVDVESTIDALLSRAMLVEGA